MSGKVFELLGATLGVVDYEKFALVLGPLLGFAFAWVLFEVTERRRIRLGVVIQ